MIAKAWEGELEPHEFASVWGALTDTPEEAANMAMRSELMIALQQKVGAWNITQAEAASRLGVTQPRLNDLLRSKIDKFAWTRSSFSQDTPAPRRRRASRP